jgi:hypothetical protein
MKLLLGRVGKQAKRDPRVIRMKIGMQVVFSLLALAIFWQIDQTGQKGKMGIVGALFFICINTFMGSFNNVVMVF